MHAQHPSVFLRQKNAVLHGEPAIDKNIFDSFRLLCRVEKIAPLTDGFRVENRKIGAEALLQQAPIF